MDPAKTYEAIASRSLRDPEVKVFIENGLKRHFAQWPPDKWDFNMLTLAALYYNQDIKIAEAEFGISKAKVITAKQIPNPVVSLVPEFISNPGLLSPWAPAIGTGAQIETAGKRHDRVSVALAEEQSNFYNLLQKAWSIRSHLRKSLLDYYIAERRLDLLRRELEVKGKISALSKLEYQLGEISLDEFNVVQTSFISAGLSYEEAKSHLSEAKRRVASAVGITEAHLESDLLSPEPRIVFDFLNKIPDTSEIPRGKVIKEALLRRPDILSALSLYKAAESNLRLEISRQYPDVTIGPGYKWDEGINKWNIAISLSLPIFNMNAGPIAEAEAKRERAEANFMKLQTEAIVGTESALNQYQIAFSNYLRSDSLLRTVNSLYNGMEKMVKEGEMSKLDEYNYLVIRLDAELQLINAVEKVQQALSGLEDEVVAPLGQCEINPIIYEKGVERGIVK
ncbi:MAG: TolC family protein [Candidatus Kryptoniota bacterium]